MDTIDAIISVAVMVAGVVIIVASSRSKRDDYDERQVATMGKGYKWAALVMAVILGGGSILYDTPAALPVSAGDYMFLTLVVGAATFASYAAWHNAYFGVHERNTRTFGILAVLLGACMVFTAAPSGDITTVVYGLSALVVGVVVLVRIALDRREAADEGEGEDE